MTDSAKMAIHHNGRRGGKQRAYDDAKLSALFLGDEEVEVYFDAEGREIGFGRRTAAGRYD